MGRNVSDKNKKHSKYQEEKKNNSFPFICTHFIAKIDVS